MPDVGGGVELDGLLEKDLLWGQAGDAGTVTDQALDATQWLVKAECHDMPNFKKGYLDLEYAVADKVQKAQRG